MAVPVPDPTAAAVDSLRPADRSWTVAIHVDGTPRPIGSGVLIDTRRVLTCRHVLGTHAVDGLRVAFPAAEDPFLAPTVVEGVEVAGHEKADVAVLVLAGDAPVGANPAPLRRPRPDGLVGRSWWAYGFADDYGNDASGTVGADLAYGWVRIDGDSRYDVDKGFSGAGLWSPEYQAVVGLVGHANSAGDGRAFTLHAATSALPGQRLTQLVDAFSLQDSGADAAAAWGWQLATDEEGRKHWRPRARGVSRDAEAGWRFSGRTAALTEITNRLAEAGAADRRVWVVTGSPGVGKSAVLARLVTTADGDVARQLPGEDTAVRAPVGSIACAVHAKSKTALEVAQEIARAASAALPDRVEDTVDAVKQALTDRPDRGRFTVVVDALDEAATPTDARRIVRHLLVPLAEDCADVGARVLVGTRRRDDHGDLLGEFGAARHCLDLDTPHYFDQADLVAYALATLQLRGAPRPDSPYHDPQVALPVAQRVAEIATPNFLVAGLLARTHGLHDTVPVDPSSLGFLPEGKDPVQIALDTYLARMIGIAGLPPATVLLPLAYAESPGLTPDLWAVALQALTNTPVSREDVAGFAAGAAANFLIQTSDATTSYRLFHQALNDTLTAGRPIVQDQQAITDALLDDARTRGWDHAPAYLLRSLAHHAAAGGAIDHILAEPQYLLRADLARLIPLCGGTHTDQCSNIARLLRRTPHAVPAAPAERLAMFQTTELLDHLATGFTELDAPTPPYRPLWAHVPRGHELVTLTGHSHFVNAVCAVRFGDRDLLASGSDDETVRLWDPASGQLVTTLEGHTGMVRAVCVVRVGDRDLVASGSDDETVRLWDPASGQPVTTLEGHTGMVRAVCVVRVGDRDLVASGSDDETVRLWDPASGQLVTTLEGHTGMVTAVCVVRFGDRDLVASGSHDRTVRLWDPASGQPVTTLEGHTGMVTAVCVVRVGDRDLLASGSDDRTVRLWDPASGQPVTTLEGHTGTVRAVCPVRVGDRDLLASGSYDETVRLWDPASGQLVTTLEGHTGAVTAVCVVRVGDRDLVASGSDDETVRLWDPASGQLVTTLEGHTGTVRAVCVVRVGDRDLVASGSDDETVRLWDPASGQLVTTLEGHTDWVTAVCVVRVGDRDLVASGSYDETVRLWDPASGQLVTTLEGHTGMVTAVCVVRVGDRDLVASGSDDETVRLWDPASGQLVTTLEGHTDWVNAVCVVRVGDRDLLASGSYDRTVRLWDPATWREGCRIHTPNNILGLADLSRGIVGAGLAPGLMAIAISPQLTNGTC